MSRFKGDICHQVLFIFFFDELQRGRVHAITLVGWPGSIVEDMAQVRVTYITQNLGAAHEKALILFQLDVVLIERGPETGPTGPGVVLCV